MSPSRFFSLVGVALVVSLASADQPAFQVKTKRDDDVVQIRGDAAKTTFDVQSPCGISEATIERREARWPDAVVLRLHLKGLEKLQVSSGQVTLAASVSSQDGKKRLWRDGKTDVPLDAKSPLWMEIRRVMGDGCFELQLPKPLFDGNPRTITFSWIDFYRN